jgi:hypothetical protein
MSHSAVGGSGEDEPDESASDKVAGVPCPDGNRGLSGGEGLVSCSGICKQYQL